MLTDAQIDAIAKKEIPAWAEWTNSTRAFARAIERSVVDATIERCAHVCDAKAADYEIDFEPGRSRAAEHCADAIRALKQREGS